MVDAQILYRAASGVGFGGDVSSVATEVIVNFYKRHLGDIAKSCGDLSQGQMGAYDLLLDWHYANEKPLPLSADKLYRIGRAVTKAERDNVDSVLAELFTRTQDGYTHKRATEEMEKAQAQASFNREVGKLGGRPKKPQAPETETLPVSKNNPSGYETETERVARNNPSHKPDSREEQKQQPCPTGVGRFAEFWAEYPRHEARKQALVVWNRKALDIKADALIADVKRRKAEHRPWLDGYVPHPATYLRNERWDDAIDRRESGGESPMAGTGMVL